MDIHQEKHGHDEKRFLQSIDSNVEKICSHNFGWSRKTNENWFPAGFLFHSHAFLRLESEARKNILFAFVIMFKNLLCDSVMIYNL